MKEGFVLSYESQWICSGILSAKNQENLRNFFKFLPIDREKRAGAKEKSTRAGAFFG